MNKIVISNPLIFTDLDGTLLDHEDYSFEPALQVIHYLKKNNIPIIPNTSKTKAELVELRKELEIVDPFIVENGAAVYLPKTVFQGMENECSCSGAYWCRTFARPRSHWLSVLEQQRQLLPGAFSGFSSMTPEEISKCTGLGIEKALLAATREFGEPLRWHGSDEEKETFVRQIEEEGGTVLQGGRFLHVGDKVNKGVAMQWLKGFYQQSATNSGRGDFTTIALGDSHNDIDMLECADYAVVIRSPVHGPPPLRRKRRLLFTERTGPAGWAAALKELLGITSNECTGLN